MKMNGTDLRYWRKKNGWTQLQAAEKLGISPQTLRIYETGVRYGIHTPVTIPLSIALACAAIDSGLKPFSKEVFTIEI